MTMWARANKKRQGPHQIRAEFEWFFCFIHPLRFIPNTFLTILNVSFLLIKKKGFAVDDKGVEKQIFYY